jgi:eukaryotic-like serine/threonine-protein kinase
MEQDKQYQFGPFCLDATERVLLRDGRLVPLPAKALSTLLVLLRNKGHVVEKDALMEEVWPGEDVEEGNLAQHIFMVRKALHESPEGHQYIETIPRRGYRFVAKIMDTKGRDKTIDSLAILPFSNASDDTSMEYLSDGITEGIMNSLSHLPQLKVIARHTVFRYKGVSIDPQEVGRALEVGAVMMGRIHQLRERLVISAELVNVEDGSRIWGDQFQRESTDIFSVPEELAREISEKLRLRLSGKQRDRLTKRFTRDREAYEFYLRGRYSWSKRSNDELRKGVRYFQQAIARDRHYSLAYAGLADCLLLLGLFGAERPRLVMPQAKEAAIKSIELDETLGEAHASLAQIKFLYDWDWAGAAADFQQSARLSPTYPTVHQWHGEYLAALGHSDEGIAELKRARDLDPLSLIINTNLGLAYYWARQYDLAIEQFERVIEQEPNFFRAHLHLGMAYERKAMDQEALAELKKARLIHENQFTLAGLGHAYASFGAKAEATNLLKRLVKLSRTRYVSAVTIAVIYAGFGDKRTQTLEWLEKACEERAGLVVWLRVWPIFDDLRSDPRFVRLLRRLGQVAFAER